jgi:hypothetical protein
MVSKRHFLQPFAILLFQSPKFVSDSYFLKFESLISGTFRKIIIIFFLSTIVKVITDSMTASWLGSLVLIPVESFLIKVA